MGPWGVLRSNRSETSQRGGRLRSPGLKEGFREVCIGLVSSLRLVFPDPGRGSQCILLSSTSTSTTTATSCYHLVLLLRATAAACAVAGSGGSGAAPRRQWRRLRPGPLSTTRTSSGAWCQPRGPRGVSGTQEASVSWGSKDVLCWSKTGTVSQFISEA